MHIPKRLIRMAKERALARFSTLAEQTVVEADNVTTRALEHADPAELRNLNLVRSFLRGEARTLRARMDRHFAGLLERAMATMHIDLRSRGQQIDYASLTLIDDDVVVRQIEVERMAARLREAESGPLGRITLTIAVMHNDRDARERENPFRPYVLARALYEALRELMWEEAQSKLLYDTLGQAMAMRLPGFYADILDVFEAGGVSARLAVRPAAMSRAEKDRLAWQQAARRLLAVANAPGPGGFLGDGLRPDELLLGPSTDLMHGPSSSSFLSGPGPATIAAHGHLPLDHPDYQLYERMLPKLKRLRDIERMAVEASHGGRKPDLLDVIWDMFHLPHGAPAPRRVLGAPRTELDQALLAMQQHVAGGGIAPAPLALRGLLAETAADSEQTRIMDVCALLFEWMIHDELLTPLAQRQFARLFLPVVRAALLEPALLHDGAHPVRRLLDRLGTLGARLAPELPGPVLVDGELEEIVGAVLDLFDDDMFVFGDAEAALDSHVAARLAALDARVAGCADAIAEAVADSGRLAAAGKALSRALQPLQVDPRLADFVLDTWARVLSHRGADAEAALGLLPELLWSAQAQSTPEERAALMRMLPALVQRVRAGMASIALPEAPSKAAFDRLVAVHMDVLAGKQEQARRGLSLQQFRDHFAGFTIEDGAAADDGWVGGFELEAALARRAITVELHTKAAARIERASDAAWLAWARPGTGFEIQVEERFRPALLCAAAGRHAFVFHIDGLQQHAVYLRAPLIEAIELGHLRALENAPLFDRAVESLMAGAESLAG